MNSKLKSKRTFNYYENLKNQLEQDEVIFNDKIFCPRVVCKSLSDEFIDMAFNYIKNTKCFIDNRESLIKKVVVLVKDHALKDNIEKLNLHERNKMDEFLYVYNNLNKYSRKNSKINYSVLLDSVLGMQKKDRNLNKIRDVYLQNSFNKEISITTISKSLNKKLRVKYKKADIKGPSYDIKTHTLKEILFLYRLSKDLENNDNLLFFDELGLYTFPCNKKVWIHEGEDSVVKKPKSFPKKHVLMICSRSEILF